MGVTDARTPEAIEKDLRELIPPDDPKASRALMLSHLFITHGRETCVAQRPRCGECCVAEHCRYCREKNGCEQ